jgi:uncharacterized membrane protein
MKSMTAPSKVGEVSQARDWLRWVGIVLAVLGLAVAVYMSYAELSGQETSCPGATDEAGAAGAVAVDCGFVQSSIYSKVLGIPVAVIGVAGYLAILGVWLLEDRIDFLKSFGHLLVFGMALFGFLFEGYLTYAELFIMYTVCTWCLLTAVFMTSVFIVATLRLVQHFRQPAT